MNRHRHPSAGAVYVEFLIAIVPLLAAFWGILQLNGLMVADLVVRHAAVNAVRAAVVCDSDAPAKGAAETDQAAAANAAACAKSAAILTVAAVKSIQDIDVVVKNAKRTGSDPVTAVATAHYACRVPFVGAAVCGLAGGSGIGSASVTIERQATLPNQGAYYYFGDPSLPGANVN